MRPIRILPLVIGMVFFSTSLAFAGERTITKEYTFLSDTAEFAYQPDKTIKEDGHTYALKGISYQQIRAEDLYVSKEVSYQKLAKKQVPLQKDFSIDGKNLTLRAKKEDIKYIQTIHTSTETRNDRTSPPDFPKQKTIREGGRDYKASLKGVTQKKGSKPFTANVQFIGTPDADFYFNGKKVALRGDTPAWSGYEEPVLRYLKLEPGSRITGAVWAGGWKTENGKPVRYARFTGTRPSSDYTASYLYRSYRTKVLYDNGAAPGAKQYTVKAVCEYEKTGMSLLQKVICAGVGILVLAGLVTLILYLISRRKKAKAVY